MDEEWIEIELSPVCYICKGSRMYSGRIYDAKHCWCPNCGGSGRQRTVCHYYQLYAATDAPPPWLDPMFKKQWLHRYALQEMHDDTSSRGAGGCGSTGLK